MDSETEPPVGATADLPHDRITVQRFRDSFPRARWSDRLNAWFVPGRTAGKRIGRWLAEMEAEADAFADEKGMDAFAFDPIESRYLDAAPSGLQIRTPYSRTVVTEIREIPLARWDADRRLWAVPYRSLDELRQRWPAIEAAASRNEPDERKARREALKGTEEDDAAKARTSERRRKRYPVPVDDVPHSIVRSVRTWASSSSPIHMARWQIQKLYPRSIFNRDQTGNTSGRLGGRGLLRNWSRPGQPERRRPNGKWLAAGGCRISPNCGLRGRRPDRNGVPSSNGKKNRFD